MPNAIFCGRQADLGNLEHAWHRATQPGGWPQIAVLLADSGMGKTRLAQEFFGALSRRTPASEKRYWPPMLEREGNNLAVNPNLKLCDATAQPSFLWWGIRFADKIRRNAGAASAIDTDLPIVATHLYHLAGAIRSAERQDTVKRLLGEFAADVGIELADLALHLLPGGPAIKAAAKTTVAIHKLTREHFADDSKLALSEVAAHERRSKAERVTELFLAVMAALDNQLPICVLADDGHFSSADPDAVDLLRRLVGAARANRWPLLLLVTHWPREWHTGESPLAVWLKTQAGNIAVHTLGKVDNLRPLLQQAFPGLSADQQKAILDKVDGNPEFLEEVIRYLEIEVRHFTNRNRQKELTPRGFADVLSVAQDRHRIARERIVAAGLPVRHALALSSVQGVRFLTNLTIEVSAILRLEANNDAISKAEKPHAFVRRDGIVAEFIQRLYLDVAAQDLPNHADERDVRTALVQAVRLWIDNDAVLEALSQSDRRATLALAAYLLQSEDDPQQISRGIEVSVTLIEELLAQFDYQAAGVVAAQVVDRWMLAGQ